MPINDNRTEPKIVDINDVSLALGETQQIDAKDDWQARACPPPAGTYALELTMDNAEFEQGHKQGYADSDPNGVYYRAQVGLSIKAEGSKWDGAFLYFNVSTGIPKGKRTSTMAGILLMCGVKVPPSIQELALARLFYKAVTTHHPVLVAECDWASWDMAKERWLHVGMTKHPKVNGVIQHINKDSTGQEVVAKLKVTKWIGKMGSPQAQAALAKANRQPVVTKPVDAKPKVKDTTPEIVEESIEVSEVSLGDDGEAILMD